MRCEDSSQSKMTYIFLGGSGNSGYPVGHMHLGNTGAEEQMYRVQYEDFGLVHNRVVMHIKCPGEDNQ